MIFDEVVFYDNLDELIKVVFVLLIWGGKVCIISIYDGEENLFNLFIKECCVGKKLYKVYCIIFIEVLS